MLRPPLAPLAILVMAGGCGRYGYDLVDLERAVPSGSAGKSGSFPDGGAGVLGGGGGSTADGGAGSLGGGSGSTADGAAGVLAGGSGSVADGSAGAGGSAGGQPDATAAGGTTDSGASDGADAGGCVEDPLPIDTTLDGPVAANCVPGALICDDMESPPPPQTMHVVSSNAIATRTNCNAAHGARSMHIVLPARTAVTGVTYYQLPSPVANGTLYGREWLHLSDVASNWIDVLEFGYSGGKTSIDIMSDASFRYNVLSGGAFPQTAAGAVPLGRWFCITFSVQVGNPGHVTADIDGTRLIDATPNTYASDYTTVFFGAWVNRGAAGLEYYVDDVVVATQPVGCN
jgi:hypothetical protein